MGTSAARNKDAKATGKEKTAASGSRGRGRRGKRRKVQRPTRRLIEPEQLDQLRRDWNHCT